MEPNKLEREFREKLNEREINPSDRAWDRLDAMLQVAEESKPKRKYTWMYVAAGFIGFLLISTIYFSQKELPNDRINNPVVVKEEQPKDSVGEVKNEQNKIISKSLNNDVLVIKETEKVLEEKNQQIKQHKTNQNQVEERSIIKEANNENWKNNQKTESKINQTAIVENSKNVTVDQLLVSAEKTLAMDKGIQQKNKVKINANDLLSQVDGELELSFREKVINKVNKNYQTVKVALANRNAEE